ncbi:MAG: hypothetical protein KJ831_14610 [Candidatus Eisenbacteria bacterium]|nr:hypothetical protein [Candidatus Eisenbacteria bacterium]
MQCMSRLTTLVAILLLVALSSASSGADLEEHLRFLEPLLGLNWEGGYVGDNVPDLVISLRFEPVLNGMAVKYSREVVALNFFSETHFFWSPNRKEVLFIDLNSRGIVGEGVVALQDGNIVLRGHNHWPEESKEFETVLQLDPTGVLKDTFKLKENGELAGGHYQEFRVKE